MGFQGLGFLVRIPALYVFLWLGIFFGAPSHAATYLTITGESTPGASRTFHLGEGEKLFLQTIDDPSGRYEVFENVGFDDIVFDGTLLPAKGHIDARRAGFFNPLSKVGTLNSCQLTNIFGCVRTEGEQMHPSGLQTLGYLENSSQVLAFQLLHSPDLIANQAIQEVIFVFQTNYPHIRSDVTGVLNLSMINTYTDLGISFEPGRFYNNYQNLNVTIPIQRTEVISIQYFSSDTQPLSQVKLFSFDASQSILIIDSGVENYSQPATLSFPNTKPYEVVYLNATTTAPTTQTLNFVLSENSPQDTATALLHLPPFEYYDLPHVTVTVHSANPDVSLVFANNRATQIFIPTQDTTHLIVDVSLFSTLTQAGVFNYQRTDNVSFSFNITEVFSFLPSGQKQFINLSEKSYPVNLVVDKDTYPNFTYRTLERGSQTMGSITHTFFEDDQITFTLGLMDHITSTITNTDPFLAHFAPNINPLTVRLLLNFPTDTTPASHQIVINNQQTITINPNTSASVVFNYALTPDAPSALISLVINRNNLVDIEPYQFNIAPLFEVGTPNMLFKVLGEEMAASQSYQIFNANPYAVSLQFDAPYIRDNQTTTFNYLTVEGKLAASVTYAWETIFTHVDGQTRLIDATYVFPDGVFLTNQGAMTRVMSPNTFNNPQNVSVVFNNETIRGWGSVTLKLTPEITTPRLPTQSFDVFLMHDISGIQFASPLIELFDSTQALSAQLNITETIGATMVLDIVLTPPLPSFMNLSIGGTNTLSASVVLTPYSSTVNFIALSVLDDFRQFGTQTYLLGATLSYLTNTLWPTPLLNVPFYATDSATVLIKDETRSVSMSFYQQVPSVTISPFVKLDEGSTLVGLFTLAAEPITATIFDISFQEYLNPNFGTELISFSSTQLIFHSANWSTGVSVVMTAIENNTLTFEAGFDVTITTSHPSARYFPATFNFNVTDNDSIQPVFFLPDVTEGISASGSLGIALNRSIITPLTATLFLALELDQVASRQIHLINADATSLFSVVSDMYRSTEIFLTFDSSNWNVSQTFGIDVGTNTYFLDNASVVLELTTTYDTLVEVTTVWDHVSTTFNVLDATTQSLVIALTSSSLLINEGHVEEVTLRLKTFPFTQSGVTLLFNALDQYLLPNNATQTSHYFSSTNWEVPQVITLTRATDSFLYLQNTTERIQISNEFLFATPVYLAHVTPILESTLSFGFAASYAQGSTASSTLNFLYSPYQPTTFQLHFSQPSLYTGVSPLFAFTGGASTVVFDSSNWSQAQINLITSNNSFWGEFTTVLTVTEALGHYLPASQSMVIKHDPLLTITDRASGLVVVTQPYSLSEGALNNVYIVHLSATPLSPVTASIGYQFSDSTRAITAVWASNDATSLVAPTGTTAYVFKLDIGDDDFYQADTPLTLVFHFSPDESRSATHLIKYHILNNDSITATWLLSNDTVTESFNLTQSSEPISTQPEWVSLSIKLNRSVADPFVLSDFNDARGRFEFSGNPVLAFDSSNWNVPQIVTFSLSRHSYISYQNHIGFGLPAGLNVNNFLNIPPTASSGIPISVLAEKAALQFIHGSSITIDLYEGELFSDALDIPMLLTSTQFLSVNISSPLYRLVTITLDPFVATNVTHMNKETSASFYSQTSSASLQLNIQAIDNNYPAFPDLTAGSIMFNAHGSTMLFYVNHYNDDSYYTDHQFGANTIFKSVASGTTIQVRLRSAPYGSENINLNIKADPLSHVTFAPNAVIFTKDNWNIYQTVQLLPVYDPSITSDASLTVSFILDKSNLSEDNPWYFVPLTVGTQLIQFVNTEYLEIDVSKSHNTIIEGQSATLYINATNFVSNISDAVTLSINVILPGFLNTIEPATQLILSQTTPNVSITFIAKRNIINSGTRDAVFEFTLADQPSNVITTVITVGEYNTNKVSACGFENTNQVKFNSAQLSQAYVERLYTLMCGKDLNLFYDNVGSDFISPRFMVPSYPGTSLVPLYAGYTAATESRHAIFFDENSDGLPDFAMDNVTGEIYKSNIDFHTIDVTAAASQVVPSNTIGIVGKTEAQIIYSVKPGLTFYVRDPTPTNFSLYVAENQGQDATKLLTENITTNAQCDAVKCLRTIRSADYQVPLRFNATQSIFVAGSLGQSMHLFVQSPLSIEKLYFDKYTVRIGDIVKGYMLFKSTTAINDVKLRALNHTGLRMLGNARFYEKDNQAATLREAVLENGASGEHFFNIGNISAAQASKTLVLEYRLSFGLAAKLENKPMPHSVGLQSSGADATNYISTEFKLRFDPLFDTALLFGKVFVDNNDNGIQDGADEIGIANVEIITEQGQSIKTDSYGRYNVPNLQPGRHHIRLNKHTLGKQYIIGKTSKLVNVVSVPVKANFAVQEQKAPDEKSLTDPYYQGDGYTIYKQNRQQPFIQLMLDNNQPKTSIFRLLEPMRFRVHTNYIYYIKHWKIDIFNQDDEVIHTLSGNNQVLGDVIQWNGESARGIPYIFEESQNLYYQLSIEDKLGHRIKTDKYLFIPIAQDIYVDKQAKSMKHPAFYPIDTSKLPAIKDAYTLVIQGENLKKVAIDNIEISGVKQLIDDRSSKGIEFIVPKTLELIKVLSE